MGGRLLGERLGRRAGNHEVPVAVGLVNAAYRWPVLVAPQSGRFGAEAVPRVRRVLALVGVLPFAADQHLRGVGSVAQRIVLPVVFPRRHAGDLLPDRDHGVTETVEFGEVLALGRLDHQGARDRE